MSVPSGATHVDYNFSVEASGGGGFIYAPPPFRLALDDLASGTTLQERSDFIEAGMDAIRTALIAQYPGATVNCSRYYTKTETGDAWPIP